MARRQNRHTNSCNDNNDNDNVGQSGLYKQQQNTTITRITTNIETLAAQAAR
jgi:hypothetical protein